MEKECEIIREVIMAPLKNSDINIELCIPFGASEAVYVTLDRGDDTGNTWQIYAMEDGDEVGFKGMCEDILKELTNE